MFSSRKPAPSFECVFSSIFPCRFFESQHFHSSLLKQSSNSCRLCVSLLKSFLHSTCFHRVSPKCTIYLGLNCQYFQHSFFYSLWDMIFQFGTQVVCAACLFLAAKVEEHRRKIQDVISVVRRLNGEVPLQPETPVWRLSCSMISSSPRHGL